ncbi:hypothetical protein SLA2020_263050 [Shorea laevis]
MKELIRGKEFREFCRLVRYGTTIYVAQRRANGHRRFLELSEYGVGWWRSFMVISEGGEGRGWVGCAAQLRKVVNFFEPSRNAGRRIKKSSVPSVMQLVEGRRMFAEALVGKNMRRK